MSSVLTPERCPDGVPAGLVDAVAELDLLAQEADALEEHVLAASTKRYYETDFAQYRRWCARLGKTPLPCDPDDVRLYITDLYLRRDADGLPMYKASTIERHLASLSHHHDSAGFGRGLARHPAIARALRGIKHVRQEKTDRKRPLLLDDLTRLIADFDHDLWPAGVIAARDTFAFGLTFATAMRREELSGLKIEDVHLEPLDGIWVELGKSKTDQSGQGVRLPVPYGRNTITCVPCAWVRWLRLLAASDDRAARMRLVRETPRDPADWPHVCRGEIPAVDPRAALLRRVVKNGRITAASIGEGGLNQALKRRLTAAGYDPDPYGMHSLRAGMVTQARRNGADARSVRRQTRHASDSMVDMYDREWNPLASNAVLKLGL